MKKFLQHYGYMMYLVGALAGFANMNLHSWQCYAIVLPVVALVTWGQQGEIK